MFGYLEQMFLKLSKISGLSLKTRQQRKSGNHAD